MALLVEIVRDHFSHEFLGIAAMPSSGRCSLGFEFGCKTHFPGTIPSRSWFSNRAQELGDFGVSAGFGDTQRRKAAGGELRCVGA